MYRDDRYVCPRCSDSVALERVGRRWRCGACAGVLVPTADIEEMIAEMVAVYENATLASASNPDKWRPAPPPSPSLRVLGTLPCPRCGVAMNRQRLGEQEVDQCREHGYWFDGNELSLVLARMGGVVTR